MGSCYGSVGKPVTSNFRGPQFESSHRQNFILHIYCQMYWRAKNKEKEVGNGPFLKKLHLVFGDWQSSAFFRSKLILVTYPFLIDTSSSVTFLKKLLRLLFGNFWGNWATFYSPIWSHCTLPTLHMECQYIHLTSFCVQMFTLWVRKWKDVKREYRLNDPSWMSRWLLQTWVENFSCVDFSIT